MANTIHVDVVSAEESIFSGEAEFVVLPGEVGELGIYPQHTPLITRIKAQGGLAAVATTPAAAWHHAEVAAHLDEDRSPAPDIEAVRNLVADGRLLAAADCA